MRSLTEIAAVVATVLCDMDIDIDIEPLAGRAAPEAVLRTIQRKEPGVRNEERRDLDTLFAPTS